MRITRAVLFTTAALALGVAAAMSACVSNNPAGPEVGDSAAPGEDTGTPSVDSAPSPDSPPPADAGADTTVTPVDSGPSVDAADSSVPQAQVRLAWLAASGTSWPTTDAGLSLGLDFCVSPHGTGTWQGPLLASAGLTAGLQPYEVTAYFSVPAGSDDVRILPAGYVTCEEGTPWPGLDAGDGGSPVQTLTNLAPIAAGSAITVAISDSLAIDDAGVDGVIVLADETSAPPGMANIRFVNVSQNSAPATYGLGSGVAFVPTFLNVTPMQELDPTADPAGYRSIPPLSSIDTTIISQTTSEYLGSALTTQPFSLPAGTLFTTFAIGVSTPQYAYILLSCFDGQSAPGSAALTSCTATTSEPAAYYTEFGNFLADSTAPSVDVCIKYHELPTFEGPLLGGPDAGPGGPSLSPPGGIGTTPTALSTYLPLAGGFSFDVRYVTPGGDCSTGLGPDYLYGTSSTSVYSTVAVTGFLAPPSDAGEPSLFDAGPAWDGGPDAGFSPGLSSVAMTWFALPDDGNGTYAARVLNFAAFNPQPFDVSGPSWSFTDIPYGALGTDASGFVDANGYLAVGSSNGPFTVTDTIGGGNVADLSFEWVFGAPTTFFIYTQGSAAAVGVLMCTWDFPCTVLNGG